MASILTNEMKERARVLRFNQQKGFTEIKNIIVEEFFEDGNVDQQRLYETIRTYCRFSKDTKADKYSEIETHHQDGSIDLLKKIVFNENEEKTPDNILKKLGYEPECWVMVSHSFGTWETYVKDEGLQLQTTVRVKLKPRENAFSVEEALQIAKDLFSKEIKPLKIKPKSIDKSLNDDLLLEAPAMELHLSKMAWNGDVGEDYDKDIAEQRFKHILKKVIKKQHIEKCGTAVVYIGNDFFNSDTVDNTTTKGTLQSSDTRWKKMFLLGLSLYTEFLLTLREHFNKIDVKLCQGNHDIMSSFYLFIALQEGLKKDNIIKFSDDLRETQAYIFGNNLIITNHGAVNLKRLTNSIPSEFYREWGMTTTRHLHLGHLHKEFSIDDQNGLIVWRVGSPSGTDEWHYHERFVGAIQKYQTFTWHKNNGLLSVNYINFTKKRRQ